MTLVFSFLVIFLLIGAAVGYRFSKSRIWQYIDAFYYPLAAIGVALLFANAQSQRQLLEISRVTDEKATALQSLEYSRPRIDFLVDKDWLNNSLESIRVISSWRKICAGWNPEPRCRAVEPLLNEIDSLLAVANERYPSDGLRLSAVCAAGDRMLANIRAQEAMSTIVSNELLDGMRV